MHYVYDGDGRRVQTIAPGGATTTFVYDAFGQMVADYGAPSSGTPPCQTCYLSWDHLGTTRMVTDQNGNAVSRHDFAPFGDELISGEAGRGNLWGASDPVRQKFTGAEQDNQDVNFFQARYYLAPQGRFNSPDPANFGADILNPQSWNGYSYVTNSPLSNVDPSGLSGVAVGGWNFGGEQSGSGGQSGGVTFFGWCFSGCGGGSSGSGKGGGKPQPKKAAPQPAGWQASQIGNNAPSNGLSKYEQSLPNCWAVGGKAVLQAGADTLGPLTDAAGAVKQLAEEGLNMASMYYNNKAAFYSATTVNTAGTVGLLVPLRSSIYRGLLSTSAELGEAASGATLALFDYNLGKQIYNEITNPTPCR